MIEEGIIVHYATEMTIIRFILQVILLRVASAVIGVSLLARAAVDERMAGAVAQSGFSIG